MKRFYKIVDIAPAPGGFAVLLDGRPVKTPARNALVLPTEELARAIAAEWRGQGDDVIATSMPLLRLSNTIIDGVAAQPRPGHRRHPALRRERPALLPRPPAARSGDAPAPGLGSDAGLGPPAPGRALIGSRRPDPCRPNADAIAALREALSTHDAFTLGALHVIASITGTWFWRWR